MQKRVLGYLGYDLAGAIQYVDAFWTTVKSNDANFKGRHIFVESRLYLF